MTDSDTEFSAPEEPTFVKQLLLKLPLIVITMAAVAAVMMALLGYGNNFGAYQMLNSWDLFRLTGQYVPSSGQGSPVAELLIGITSMFGGHLLSNALTLGAGLGSIYLMRHFLQEALPKERILSSLAFFIANPFFLIAASSSVNYVYALFFFLLALTLHEAQKFRLGALMMLLAVGCRFEYIIFALIFYIGHRVVFRGPYAARAGDCVIQLLATSVLLFMPSFAYHGYNLGFFGIYLPESLDIVAHSIQFLRRFVALIGWPSLILLVSWLIWASQTSTKALAKHSRLLTCWRQLAWSIIGANVLLFLFAPKAPEMLIPCVFALPIAVSSLPRLKRLPVMAVLAFLQMLYWGVSIDLMRVHYEGRERLTPVAVSPTLKLGAGVLLQDLFARDDEQREFTTGLQRVMAERRQ